jgi:N-succinyldiaminopimelate aminotransferase
MIDLGQGWPALGDNASMVARTAAADAILKHTDPRVNQYAPINGRPELQDAISSYYARQQGVTLDPQKEVFVATSGTEALYCSMLALVNPGDEVIFFEPFFPWYLPHIQLADGVPRAIQLQPPNFELDVAALKAAVTPKTKLIILNSPHNPSGRVFTMAEMEAVAEVVREQDLLVISDEVYEGTVFPGHGTSHLRFAELPEMRERTVTIGSASKLFSLCGWRVGWATGPADLVAAAKDLHGFVTFSAPT